MRRLEERLERRMVELHEEMVRLNERADRLYGQMQGFTKWIIGLLASIRLTLVALLLPVLVRLVGAP